MRPEQLHLIRQWIEKAEEDYKNAEYTLTLEEDCPVSTVCFHSQQCIEKYLKALLICHFSPVPKSHDLVELYNRLPSGNKPTLSEEGLAILNRYAVESRYPGGWEVILRSEAEDAFHIARMLRQAIRDDFSKMMESIEGA
jgi:HEPN domain-containing protein